MLMLIPKLVISRAEAAAWELGVGESWSTGSRK